MEIKQSIQTLKIKDGNFVRTQNEPKTWVNLSGKDAVAQRIKHRLKLWKGEWFLNRSKGVDWISVFEKPFSIRKMKSEIYRELQKDEQIDQIENLEVISNFGRRSLQIELSVKILSGSETLRISEELRDL